MIKSYLLKLLNKKVLKYSDKVELSTGTIYLKPLTNGIINKCRQNSCIAGDVLNDPMFFNLMDYELTNLSKKQIDSMSAADGLKLRNHIKNLLLKAKVIKVEGVSNPESFSVEDIEKINLMKSDAKNDLNKLFDETGYKTPGLEVD